MNISISVEKISVDPNGNRNITVDLDGIDKEELLDNFTIKDCLDFFGIDKVLEEIGAEECKEHFDLSETIEED